MRLFDLFRERPPAMDAELGGAPVSLQARAKSYGTPTRKVSGTGTLTLTPDELVFEQGLPHRFIRIPRPAISAVEKKKQFGATRLPSLMKVEWKTADGDCDWMIFMVKEMDRWIEEIARA